MPADTNDQDLKAQMWAKTILPTVTYEQAQARIISHYQSNTSNITIADINGATGDKTPMYLVPQHQRPAPPTTPDPDWDTNTPAPPCCPECGRHWIHDTEIRSNGTPVCSQAPGRVVTR